MEMRFELEVDNASKKELEGIYARLEFEFKDCQGYTKSDYTPLTEFLIPEHVFRVYDLVNWDYLEEVIELSKEYPNAFFTLYCADDCVSLWGTSQWVTYFKNGESREYQAEIHFPENPFYPAS